MLPSRQFFFPARGYAPQCAVLKQLLLQIITTYGNSFLLGTDQAGRIKLQRAKNRGLKIALNKNARYCTNLLHKDARLATWEVRARMALTKLMFKYKHQEEYIERNDAERLTRLQSGPFFRLALPKTNRFRNSVWYLGRVEWNSLPSYIRCTKLFVNFKKEIKLLYNYRFFSSISVD